MQRIPLTRGKVALVDNVDFVWLCQWHWTAMRGASTWYAYRQGGCGNGKRRTIYMHRAILDASSCDDIDHRNGKGLDNQRENLRLCTASQNNANAKKRSKCTSKYKGVSWDKNKWKVNIYMHGKRTYLGRFDNEILAAIAYNEAAPAHHGEFARLNML